MRSFIFKSVVVSALSSTVGHAADTLPLTHGIYVPASSACKGASNAEIVNYWGGNASLGSAWASCTITKLSTKANVYRSRRSARMIVRAAQSSAARP